MKNLITSFAFEIFSLWHIALIILESFVIFHLEIDNTNLFYLIIRMFMSTKLLLGFKLLHKTSFSTLICYWSTCVYLSFEVCENSKILFVIYFTFEKIIFFLFIVNVLCFKSYCMTLRKFLIMFLLIELRACFVMIIRHRWFRKQQDFSFLKKRKQDLVNIENLRNLVASFSSSNYLSI